MKNYQEIEYDDIEALEKIISEKKYLRTITCESCEDCEFDIEDEICTKKILKNLVDLIKDRYNEYERSLEKITIHKKEKEALEKLYSSPTKTARELKMKIKTKNEYLVCPYCGIGEISTIEHILPKGLFPEFSIYSANLIPCCYDCNSLKGDNIKDNTNNEYVTYNFYQDEVPNEELLKIEIILKDGIPIAKYSVDDRASNLFKNHVKSLDLLERYKKKANLEFAELKKMIEMRKEGIVIKDIKEEYKKKYKELLDTYGYNYFRGLLKLAIAESDDYLKHLFGVYKNVERIEYLFRKVPEEEMEKITIKVVGSKAGYADRSFDNTKEEIEEIKKGTRLSFEGINEEVDYEKVMWKIKNEGREAIEKDVVMGNIIPAIEGNKLKDKMTYEGLCKVECYFIKENICIARGRIEIEVIA